MRVTKQVMAENNKKIIHAAARLLREKGIENTSVADVMGAAGLTHGGFYRHFSSKDELVAVAIKTIFDDMVEQLENNIARQGKKQAIAHYISGYLSEQHIDNPGKGCPIAALGAEVDRQYKVHKEAITSGSQQLASLLALGFEGASSKTQAKAFGLLATLVGTIILARSAGNKALMKKILSSGYEFARHGMAIDLE